uniref:Polycystin-1 n=1 Tax=Petromyzon marinus TaxID=7757 RepID=A0AAJ7UC60_PETMA|nr:polycystin-1 [Petromyzon marinus]
MLLDEISSEVIGGCFMAERSVCASLCGLSPVDKGRVCPCVSLCFPRNLTDNKIFRLGVYVFRDMTSLLVLDLSDNQIGTLPNGVFDNLTSLAVLDVSGNPLDCGCELAWLPQWLAAPARAGSVALARPLRSLCALPDRLARTPVTAANFSSAVCAADYVACLRPASTLIFSAVDEDAHDELGCNVACARRRLAYFSSDPALNYLCLCGDAGGSPALDCAAVCSAGYPASRAVCGRVVVAPPAPVRFGATFLRLRPFSVFEAAEFRVAPWYDPGAGWRVRWDFGDGAAPLDVAGGDAARHKFALPGTYAVTASVSGGGGGPTATAGAAANVTVAMPVLLPPELRCPKAALTGGGGGVAAVSRSGTSVRARWSVREPDGTVRHDAPACPAGGRASNDPADAEGGRPCYLLVTAPASWHDARAHCRRSPGGDLAVVADDATQRLVTALSNSSSSVWLGLSDTESPGTLLWVDARTPERFEVWATGEPSMLRDPGPGGRCVRAIVSQHGRWGTENCTEVLPYVCRYEPGVLVEDVRFFLLGSPAFSAHLPVVNVTVTGDPAPSLASSVQVMVFPGLWFAHRGVVQSLEVAVLQRRSTVQLRLQVVRPHCGPGLSLSLPGCARSWSPFSTCVADAADACNATAGPCPPGLQWCRLSAACVPVGRPCGASVPAATSPPPPAPSAASSQRWTPPAYEVVREVVALLHAGEAAHANIVLGPAGLEVSPDLVLALQHDAGAPLLDCPASATPSPWRQPCLTLDRSAGWAPANLSAGVADDGAGAWLRRDDCACDLRALYTDGAGLPSLDAALASAAALPGARTYNASLGNPVGDGAGGGAGCTVEFRPPVSGLRLASPQAKASGAVYVNVSASSPFVFRVDAGSGAVLRWLLSGGDRARGACDGAAAFSAACPAELPAAPAAATAAAAAASSTASRACAGLGGEFAALRAPVREAGTYWLRANASNGLSEESAVVTVQAEQPVAGLTMLPAGSGGGAQRVLVDVTLVFSARVAEGTSVTYTWVLDGLTVFAYSSQQYNLVFHSPAVYRLKVTAENAVSREWVEAEIHADTMNPLAALAILDVPAVFPVNGSLQLAATVRVDANVAVLFRWCFGDGSANATWRASPPYEAWLPRPEPGVERVLLQHNVTHTYTEAGSVNLSVEAITDREHLQTVSTVDLRSPLTAVLLRLLPAGAAAAAGVPGGEPSLGVVPADVPVTVEAVAVPSGYRVVYAWDLGDGPPVQDGASRVTHAFAGDATYTVHVVADNGVSHAEASANVTALRRLSGVTVLAGAVDLGSLATVAATLATGSADRWDFDMGDGTVYVDLREPLVTHNYTAEGAHSVTANASNALGAVTGATTVWVYRLRPSDVLVPPGCVAAGADVSLSTSVSAFARNLSFCWDFGDGDVTEGVDIPAVEHAYAGAGNFSGSLVVRSLSGASNRQEFVVCVRGAISRVELAVTSGAVSRLGQPTEFSVAVEPPGEGCTYTFRFGDGAAPEVLLAPPFRHVYAGTGAFTAAVNVSNGVSAGGATAPVEVQEAVGMVRVTADGAAPLYVAVNRTYLFAALPSAGTAPRYSWDFGDGAVSHGGNGTAAHAFSTGGAYAVTATVFNDVSSAVGGLNLAALAPVSGLAIVGPDPATVETVTPAAFSAIVESGDDVAFAWASCRDCLPPAGAGSRFETAFPTAGAHAVTCVAENAVSREEVAVTVSAEERIANLTVTCDGLADGRYWETGRVLRCRALVGAGSGVGFAWSFRYLAMGRSVETNETAARSRLPQQQQQQQQQQSESLWRVTLAGEHTVAVSASNGLGSLTATLNFTALDRVADLSVAAAPNPAAVGAAVALAASVRRGTAVAYTWFVSAGAADETEETGSSPRLERSFAAAGPALVTVVAWNPLGRENATVRVDVLEPVRGLAMTTPDAAVPFYVEAGAPARLVGSVSSGSSVAWQWTVPTNPGKMSMDDGAELLYNFGAEGVYAVTVNASNAVSSEVLARDVTAQERVTGLLVVANATAAATRQTVVFTADLRTARRSAVVTLAFTAGGQATTVDGVAEVATLTPGEPYAYAFTEPGVYVGNVTARNNVSAQSFLVSVTVLDAVRGLVLVDCCPAALPSGAPASFSATVSAGAPVTFRWRFEMAGAEAEEAVGESAQYTPRIPGALTVLVNASNALSSAGAGAVVAVQERVSALSLWHNATPHALAGEPVGFAARRTSGSDLLYRWEFGDGTGTRGPQARVAHAYTEAGEYRAIVTASNNVSEGRAEIAVSVVELGCSPPTLAPVAPRPSVVAALQNYFEVTVDLRGCEELGYSAEYLWEVRRSADCARPNATASTVALDASVDARRPQLVLPGRSLAPGNYCLSFTARLSGTWLARSVSLAVSALASRPVAVIAGGTNRTWSRHDGWLLLDGSGSWDPDGAGGDGAGLVYSWDCAPKVPGTQGCFSSRSQGPLLNVSGAAMVPGASYVITLRVQAVPGKGEAGANQTVLVLEGPALSVAVRCVSCDALGRYSVSRSEQVTLSGRCLDCAPGAQLQYRWTVVDSDGAVLPLGSDRSSTGDALPDLVVRAGALADGLAYTFVLTVSAAPGGVGGASAAGNSSLVLEPNRPPAGGECRTTLMPAPAPDAALTVLETRLQYDCVDWRDPEDAGAPVLYTLVLAACSPSGGCQDTPLYRGVKARWSALLPLGGGAGAGTRHWLELWVEDQMGARALALNCSVEVALPTAPPDGLPSWLASRSRWELQAALQRGDPYEVTLYATALLSVVRQQVDGGGDAAAVATYAEVARNATLALAGLAVASMEDVFRLAASLAYTSSGARINATQASASSVCEECPERVLLQVEKMVAVVAAWVTQGKVTPTGPARSLLQVMGAIMATGRDTRARPPPGGPGLGRRAFSLAECLMGALMRTRVLHEEKLALRTERLAALGRRVTPLSLLCGAGPAPASQEEEEAEGDPDCAFQIPLAAAEIIDRRVAATAGGAGAELTQVMLVMPSSPFPEPDPLGSLAVSSRVASLELSRADDGSVVPVSDLPAGAAILVTLPGPALNLSESLVAATAGTAGDGTVSVPPGGAVNFSVNASNEDARAGLFVQVTYTPEDDAAASADAVRRVDVSLHGYAPALPGDEQPGTGGDAAATAVVIAKQIPLEEVERGNLSACTLALSPTSYDTTRPFMLLVRNRHAGSAVRVRVGAYLALCQWLAPGAPDGWAGDGTEPDGATGPGAAVCRSRHLTVFGAGMFVPPGAVSLLPPTLESLSLVAVLVCAALCGAYLVVALLARRMDLVDIRRVGVVPLCGPEGRYKYEVMVKTAWGSGSGTTAHVGISLYGREKSGARFLARDGAFRRNAADVFHIACHLRLGRLWKIRVWHDNTGLSPAWHVRHVMVRELETGKTYGFILDDWLSVENQRNDGLVERDVLAASPEDLRRFGRVFVGELQRGVSERHAWLSVLDRPARSRFTRAQRVSACALLLAAFLGVSAVWYGAVASNATGAVAGARVPVSESLSVGWSDVAVGMVTACLSFPVYVILSLVFRKSRTQISMQHVDSSELEVLEIDAYVDASEGGDSMLELPDMENYQDRKESVISAGPKSLPDLLATHAAHTGTAAAAAAAEGLTTAGPTARPSLRRAEASRSLRVDASLASSEEPLSLSGSERSANSSARDSRLTPADEELMQQILAESGRSQDRPSSDSGRFSPRADADLLSDILDPTALPGADRRPPSSRAGGAFYGSASCLPSARSRSGVVSCLSKPGSAASRKTGDSRSDTHAQHHLAAVAHSHLGERRRTGAVFLNHITPPCAVCPAFTGATCSLTALPRSLVWPTRRGGNLRVFARCPVLPAVCVRRGVRAPLPRWCATLAHGACVAGFAACIAATCLYGVSFSPSVALAWLLASVTALAASFLLLEPLKIVVEALARASLQRRVDPDEDDELVEEPLVRPAPDPMGKVRPPCGYGLLQAKEEARKLRHLKALVKSFVLHLLLLLLVLLFTYWDAPSDRHARLLAAGTRQAMLAARDGPLHLSALASSEQVWLWLGRVLLPHLYPNVSDAQRPTTLLGAPRLRQHRSATVPCVAWLAPDLPQEWGDCIGDEVAGAVTGSFGPGWTLPTPNSSLNWNYTCAGAPSAWHWGELGWYGGGGYVQDLAGNLMQSRSTVSMLQQQGWIDRMTRAVLVEFALRCRAVGLVAAVTVLFEFPVAGAGVAAVPSLSVRAARPLGLRHRDSALVLTLSVMLLALGSVRILLALWSLWRRFRRSAASTQPQPPSLFSAPASASPAPSHAGWALACWLSMALCVCAPAVTLYRLALGELLARAPAPEFQDVRSAVFVAEAATALAASLLFLSLVTVARQVRFVRAWALLGKTLERAWPRLWRALALFLTALLAFTQLGFLIFSQRVSCFRRFGLALGSLVSALRSGRRLLLAAPAPPSPPPSTPPPPPSRWSWCSAFSPPPPAQPWSSQPEAAWPWAAAAFLLLLALGAGAALARGFAAALVAAHRRERAEARRPAVAPQDYEMAEFLLKRVRLVLGLSKAKEFRHKVKFEGMESLPSRSSRDALSPPPRPPTSSSVSSSASSASSASSLLGTSASSTSRAGAEQPAGPASPAPPPREELERCYAAAGPAAERVLALFERVCELTDDVLRLELALEDVRLRLGAGPEPPPPPAAPPEPRGAAEGQATSGETREEAARETAPAAKPPPGAADGARRRSRRPELPRAPRSAADQDGAEAAPTVRAVSGYRAPPRPLFSKEVPALGQRHSQLPGAFAGGAGVTGGAVLPLVPFGGPRGWTGAEEAAGGGGGLAQPSAAAIATQSIKRSAW